MDTKTWWWMFNGQRDFVQKSAKSQWLQSLWHVEIAIRICAMNILVSDHSMKHLNASITCDLIKENMQTHMFSSGILYRPDISHMIHQAPGVQCTTHRRGVQKESITHLSFLSYWSCKAVTFRHYTHEGSILNSNNISVYTYSTIAGLYWWKHCEHKLICPKVMELFSVFIERPSCKVCMLPRLHRPNLTVAKEIKRTNNKL